MKEKCILGKILKFFGTISSPKAVYVGSRHQNIIMGNWAEILLLHYTTLVL